MATVENDSVRLSNEDVDFILRRHERVEYPDFIEKTQLPCRSLHALGAVLGVGALSCLWFSLNQ